jgi:hypothetical protein
MVDSDVATTGLHKARAMPRENKPRFAEVVTVSEEITLASAGYRLI